jgi:hypothetical protein
MPEAYSDATPVPQQTPVTAAVSARDITVPTPKPAPKRRGWLRRTLKHVIDLLKDFDPFKPGGPGGP